MSAAWPSASERVLASWQRARREMEESPLGSERYNHALEEALGCAEEYINLQGLPGPLYPSLEHEAADASLRRWLAESRRSS